MKTKAYKLAAELGLQEQSVLDWLRDNGYPNVRRADMIRSEVAQAARQALGQVRSAVSRGVTTASSLRRSSGRPDKSFNESRRRGPPTSATQGGDGFRVTFADLLDEFGGSPDPSSSPVSIASGSVSVSPITTGSRSENTGAVAALEKLRFELAQLEKERDQLRQEILVERANTESAERSATRLKHQLVQVRSRSEEAEKVIRERDRLSIECASLIKSIRQIEDENATLQGTCSDLQSRLTELDSAAIEMESLQLDHSVVLGDLETARQRETAWRARALELERAMQSGGNLLDYFGVLGIEERAEQIRLLASLASSEKAAVGLSQAVRSFDQELLDKLVRENVRATCTHVICQRVVAQRGLQAFRVDAAERCSVCGGHDDQRWFKYFAHQCALSGVKRVLVVGGASSFQTSLRQLSAGHALEIRLLALDEQNNEGRVRGRIEGCDLLVLAEGNPDEASPITSYAEVARQFNRLVVRPRKSGKMQSFTIRTLAQSAANVLARADVLTAV